MFIREDADCFFKMLGRLKADFGVVDLVKFVNNSLSSAAKGPEYKLFWEGMERLKGKLGAGGLASIMCDVVAKRTSSEKWVDAVIGVLHLTSEACVRACVLLARRETGRGCAHAPATSRAVRAQAL